VRVERDDAVVNRARLLDERGVRGGCAGAGAGARPAASRTRTETGRNRSFTTPEPGILSLPTSATRRGKRAVPVRLSGMGLLRRFGPTALACAMAAGCGGSPTAPSPVNAPIR
jgi:hypothetical protein